MATKTKMIKKEEAPIQQEFEITASLEQAKAKAADKKKSGTTRITIKFNVGFSNQVFIRGEGANLSWEKGTLLKNVKADEWVWETTQSFNTIYFKVLINDKVYEYGDNHQANYGSSLTYTPRF